MIVKTNILAKYEPYFTFVNVSNRTYLIGLKDNNIVIYKKNNLKEWDVIKFNNIKGDYITYSNLNNGDDIYISCRDKEFVSYQYKYSIKNKTLNHIKTYRNTIILFYYQDSLKNEYMILNKLKNGAIHSNGANFQYFESKEKKVLELNEQVLKPFLKEKKLFYISKNTVKVSVISQIDLNDFKRDFIKFNNFMIYDYVIYGNFCWVLGVEDNTVCIKKIKISNKELLETYPIIESKDILLKALSVCDNYISVLFTKINDNEIFGNENKLLILDVNNKSQNNININNIKYINPFIFNNNCKLLAYVGNGEIICLYPAPANL